MVPSAEPPRRVVAAIGLGSNLGDRAGQLASALRALERTPGVVVLRRSTWHETAPVGGPPGQGPYLNGAALLETRLGPVDLVERLLEIERKAGRERGEPNAPRTLDLDLLLYGDLTLDDPAATVPHPRMAERRFVLAPLAELCPETAVPGRDRTVAQLLAELPPEDGSGSAPAGARSVELVRFDEPDAARAWCRDARASGSTLGFVPTMGALHEGHLELVKRSVAENAYTCASIFVNPLQFDEKGDFERYTRDFEGDARLLASVGCSMAFTGTLRGFFPELTPDGDVPAAARVAAGEVALGLEGEFRPGHFDGVATIVDRLFDVVAPDVAYFGQKDFQQTLVVSALAARRGDPRIVVCPTVRAGDGLALSSRNARLAPAERTTALAIPRALAAARRAWQGGEREHGRLSEVMRTELAVPGVEVEYAEVRDPGAWSASAPAAPLERAVALVAARVGGVRLIDNHDLAEPFPGS